MSRNYNRIKTFYDKGLYTETQMRNLVVKGQITPDEFKQITGIEY